MILTELLASEDSRFKFESYVKTIEYRFFDDVTKTRRVASRGSEAMLIDYVLGRERTFFQKSPLHNSSLNPYLTIIYYSLFVI